MSSAYPLESPIEVTGTGGVPGQVNFSDGTNVVEVKAPIGLTGSVNFTLPPTTGTVNQVLRTSGTGITTWIYDTGPYEAIVDAGGEGDYLLPSAAFTAGVTSIFIKNGIYNETSNITLPDRGSMYGESPAGVIISFGGGAFGITANGNGGTTYSAGTISVASGSTAVVGVGTLWLTNITPGDYILIGVTFMRVASVTNDLNLVLADVYNGESLTGSTYLAQSMFNGINLRNFVVTGSTVDGILLQGCRESVISNVASVSNSTGIRETNCSQIFVCTTVITNSTTDSVVVDSSYGVFFDSMEIFNSANNGLVISGTSAGTNVDACQINGCNNFGISIQGTATITNITDCKVCYNNVKGFDSLPGTGPCVVVGCTISNNGLGIDFDGSDNNVSCNLFTNNAGFGIQAGDNGTIIGNHVNNNMGDGISMTIDDNCCVSNNVIVSNTGDGIGGIDGDNHTFNANHIRLNGGNGITITGDNHTVVGNVIVGNTGDGVNITGGDNNTITANRIGTNTNGVNITNAAATDNIVTTNNLLGNTGTNLINLGTLTIVAANKT